MRKRRLLRLVWIAVAALACWAAVRAVTTPYNQCDNMEGTCLRHRQLVAIAAVQVASIALAVLSIGTTFRSLRRPLTAKLLIGAVIAFALSISYLAVDPIAHLDNSRTDWLSR